MVKTDEELVAQMHLLEEGNSVRGSEERGSSQMETNGSSVHQESSCWVAIRCVLEGCQCSKPGSDHVSCHREFIDISGGVLLNLTQQFFCFVSSGCRLCDFGVKVESNDEVPQCLSIS